MPTYLCAVCLDVARKEDYCPVCRHVIHLHKCYGDSILRYTNHDFIAHLNAADKLKFSKGPSNK